MSSDYDVWAEAVKIASASGRGGDLAYTKRLYQDMRTLQLQLRVSKVAGFRDAIKDLGSATLDSWKFDLNLPRHYEQYVEISPKLRRLREEKDQLAAALSAMKGVDADLASTLSALGMEDSLSALKSDQLDALFEGIRGARDLDPTARAAHLDSVLDAAIPKTKLKGDARAKVRANIQSMADMGEDDLQAIEGAHLAGGRRRAEKRLAEVEAGVDELKPKSDAYVREAQNHAYATRRVKDIASLATGGTALLAGYSPFHPLDRLKGILTRPIDNYNESKRRDSETLGEKIRRQAGTFNGSAAQQLGLGLSGLGTIGTAGAAAVVAPPTPALKVAADDPADKLRPRAEILLVHNGRVYMMSTPFGWIPPGGGTDGDSGAVAAAREAEEEAGLRATNVRKLEVPTCKDKWSADYMASQKEDRVQYTGCSTDFYIGDVVDPSDMSEVYATEGDGMRLLGKWMTPGAALSLAQLQYPRGSENYRMRDQGIILALIELERILAERKEHT